MISRCPKELAPVTGLDDPTVASLQVGDDAERTRLDFSQVAGRPHLETATGRNGSLCKALHSDPLQPSGPTKTGRSTCQGNRRAALTLAKQKP